jgi:hypothetical protein
VLVEARDAQVGVAADDAVQAFEFVHHELEQLWRGVGGGGDCGVKPAQAVADNGGDGRKRKHNEEKWQEQQT